MAALKDDVKEFIVTALACFDSPAQVIADVKQQFGLVVTPQQLQAYNPATVAGARMSERLKVLFEKTREKFRADTSTIPIANQAYRLRVLQRALDKAEKQGNLAMASQLLEQAAKESGGAFTNRREITGKGGGPIQQSSVTPEQLKEAVQSVREAF